MVYMKLFLRRTGVSKMTSRLVIDTSQLNKIVKNLGEFEKQMPGAFTSALNRTLDYVYTQTGRIVTKHYNVKVSEIKDSMKKHKATFSRPQAWIRVRSRRYTLGRFLPNGLNSKSKIAKVKIKKGAGYKVVGGRPGAFVKRVTREKKNGETYTNTHVLRRVGKNRYPLEVLRTISPTEMIKSLKVMDQVRETANKKLAERIDHEIDRRLKKVGAK